MKIGTKYIPRNPPVGVGGGYRGAQHFPRQGAVGGEWVGRGREGVNIWKDTLEFWISVSMRGGGYFGVAISTTVIFWCILNPISWYLWVQHFFSSPSPPSKKLPSTSTPPSPCCNLARKTIWMGLFVEFATDQWFERCSLQLLIQKMFVFWTGNERAINISKQKAFIIFPRLIADNVSVGTPVQRHLILQQ